MSDKPPTGPIDTIDAVLRKYLPSLVATEAAIEAVFALRRGKHLNDWSVDVKKPDWRDWIRDRPPEALPCRNCKNSFLDGRVKSRGYDHSGMAGSIGWKISIECECGAKVVLQDGFYMPEDQPERLIKAWNAMNAEKPG